MIQCYSRLLTAFHMIQMGDQGSTLLQPAKCSARKTCHICIIHKSEDRNLPLCELKKCGENEICKNQPHSTPKKKVTRSMSASTSPYNVMTKKCVHMYLIHNAVTGDYVSISTSSILLRGICLEIYLIYTI